MNPAQSRPPRRSRALKLRGPQLAWMPLALALGLAACSAPPVAAPVPTAPLSAGFRHGATEVADEGAWWARFGDPILTQLVEQALAANHDVAQALARVQEAQAGQVAQASRLLPTLDLQASALDARSGLPAPVKQGQPDTRAARLGLNLAWEVDLAGGLHAARDAAQADAAAATAGVAGARLLVASEVARQYFSARSAEQRLAIVERLVAAQRCTAELVAGHVRAGQASRFELQRAEAEAEALAAQAPPLRTLVGVSQSRLAVLLGANPSQWALPAAAQAFEPTLPAIGTGAPSELLQRRPDLIAAEARYAAASLRGAEARAQWWPKLFLNALVGREDLKLNALDLAPVRFSSVALAFSAPIFNAGRIEAGVQAQSARAEQALQAWQQAVLVAVQEVEDSLLLRQQDAFRGQSLQAALAHQRGALAHGESLRREGQIDALALLDLQRAVLAAELAVADNRLQQSLNAVQLYKALGGGFGSPAATPSTRPALAALSNPADARADLTQRTQP
ncbi:MAG: efflux transporter outer membrane subunit [Burkholderiales bacterium]|uniref:efflux transporter outer membrane subunit n=1 Tax=Roseateles sp. TaxID=1971397 RepID=UPI000F9A084C|nr:MAG: efflux transporter outer membrane subunit [Burkholderiales bacterium]